MKLNTILDILLNQRLGMPDYGLSYLYPEILNNLQTYTLPIFSQYFPCYRRYPFTPDDHKTGDENEYYLKITEIDENKLDIISIANVVPKSGIEASAFSEGYYTLNITIEDAIMNSLASNMASSSNYSYKRFRYIPPNRILLRGFGTQELTVTLKIKYPSFSAIQDSVIEQFIRLALADIKIFVYNKLKHYNQLNLPIGSIDLKLELFESGEAERETIISEFNSKGYPNKAIYRYHTYE